MPFLGGTILVSGDLPAPGIVLASILGIVVIAFSAVTFEIIAALLAVSPRRRLLTSLRPNSSVTRVGGGQVTILIPAHNEEFSLPTTLRALHEQTKKLDRVIVVADNCTDSTVAIAREMGVECFESVNNVHKKGGALNQAVTWLLPECTADDFIMVMDADTSLGERYIEVASKRFEEDDELTAVGGIFYGEDGHGLIGQFQRNEYTRYSLQIKARRGRVFVLTGTASMFRADGVRGTVREGDLVSRWSGDDFLVAGPGERPDAASIQARLETYVRNSGVSLGKSPVGIQVWCVSGDPTVTTFESLVAAATPSAEA